MPSDQTPRQPQALHPEETDRPPQAGDFAQATAHAGGFSECLAGESGDPIWGTDVPQAEAGRVDRARRAGREPEGKLPAGRIIDLEQTGQIAAPHPR
jgi:hypothetical protein